MRVDALRVGDYLPQTKRTITDVYRGINTPSRCHTVEFRRDSGRTGLTHWRSDTMIDVERAEPTF